MRARRLVTLGLAAVTAVATLLLCPACRADEASARRENELKAAYLFNFAKFVEWPADMMSGSLSVCFLDSPGVFEAFAAGIGGKRIGARAVLARSVTEAESLHGCDVLYLALPGLGAAFAQRPDKAAAVLSVSEASGFIHDGGIIELFAEGNRLRFKISLANAHRAGLRISSSLLQLASGVEQEKSP